MARRASVFTLAALLFLCARAFGDDLEPRDRVTFTEKAVSRKVLENGLVLLAEETSPGDLVSVVVTVRAGSRIEGAYAGSGISHFVEHMLFKGTPSRKAGAVEEEIKSCGGVMNGCASHDTTTFYATVPAQYLAKTLSLLKDILANASFDKVEFAKERQVILNEIRLGNDDPQRRAMKELHNSAYLYHPYKYPPIGYEDRFSSLTRDDLVSYYRTMYSPDRMVIAIVGGVEPAEALKTAEAEFKGLKPPHYVSTDTVTPEPPQIGKRRSTVEMPINLAYLAMGFHSTSIFHKDLFAMDVLSMILGSGDTSRLNERLFKKERAVHSVASFNYTPRDPGLFVITAVADAGKLADAESLALDEIRKVRDGEITDRELERAKRKVVSDFIFSRQTIEQRSRDISANESLTGDYDFSRRYVEGVQAVSKEDVKRAAGLYLTDDNLTTVRVAPEGAPAGGAAPVVKAAVDDKVHKETLPNGLRLLIRESRKTPTFAMTVAMNGGLLVENASNNGISNLTARMLLKGTSTRNESRIRGALEDRGGSISNFSGFSSFGLRLSALSTDLDLAIELLKDILTDSTFPEDEIEKEKTLTLAALKAEDDDIFDRGVYTLRGLMFAGHPYGMRILGTPGTIAALNRKALIDFYKVYCVPDNMVISISGDIKRDYVINKMKGAFGAMARATSPRPDAPKAALTGVKERTITMDREESLVLTGFLTVPLGDPDRYVFEALGSLLSGQSGRMFRELRNKRYLAYALGCAQRWAVDAGYFVFYVATKKEKIAETKRSLAGIIEDIRKNAPPAGELEVSKRELVSERKTALQTNEFVSFQAALDELYGLGHDTILKYEEMVDKVT
ncbi:MAG: insulinase family protein, partial [Candidatus Omnitrophica bacterium]|nr:insulinase family protein [Candidatus Omnitrophota bacterium]